VENNEEIDQSLRKRCSTFDGFRRIAAGELFSIVPRIKAYIDRNPESSVLIFDDQTGEVVDIDFRGTTDEVLTRLVQRGVRAKATSSLIASLKQENAGAGRPKLGVVGREVTLLPRHWDWLNRQPGGASVALRKLVEEARRSHSGKDNVREVQETTYRFLSAIAGDLPGFEESLRALFAGNKQKFGATIQGWPPDLREYVEKLAAGAFEPEASKRKDSSRFTS